ncbi:MAG: aldo/keto reductase [Candidatus Obscuribacterales bacterium]|jgi:diketogulonate reductase-like aldo/keto reductase
MPVTSYNGITMPAIMYGTAWKKDATAKLVEAAVDAGFRSIDTANQLIHYDEALVGEALLALQQKGIDRQSLFLQTKFTSVNGQDSRTPYDAKANLTTQVNQSMASSLKHLHTDYIDSYVLHGPYSRQGITPQDLEVWAAMEEHFNEGRARMLGVSNVSADQLAALCSVANTRPMVVQNRCYAMRGWDSAVREICKKEGIIYQGFSLLTANPHVLENGSVQAMARRLNTGVAQIVFRFALQIGMLPLTGTTNKRHMEEDLTAEGLTLTEAELHTIENMG